MQMSDYYVGYKYDGSSYKCASDYSTLNEAGITWKHSNKGDCIKVKSDKWEGRHDCNHEHYYVCGVPGKNSRTSYGKVRS